MSKFLDSPKRKEASCRYPLWLFASLPDILRHKSKFFGKPTVPALLTPHPYSGADSVPSSARRHLAIQPRRMHCPENAFIALLVGLFLSQRCQSLPAARTSNQAATYKIGTLTLFNSRRNKAQIFSLWPHSTVFRNVPEPRRPPASYGHASQHATMSTIGKICNSSNVDTIPARSGLR